MNEVYCIPTHEQGYVGGHWPLAEKQELQNIVYAQERHQLLFLPARG